MGKINGKVMATEARRMECPICLRQNAAIGYVVWHGEKVVGRMVVCQSCTNFDWQMFQPYRYDVYTESLNALANKIIERRQREGNYISVDFRSDLCCNMA